MERIKKGLQEKLNLISKIQSNLKIKKCDMKKNTEKIHLQFPVLQNNQNAAKEQYLRTEQNDQRNPQNYTKHWMNIKKIDRQNNQTIYSTPKPYRQKLIEDSSGSKLLFASSYTSRFTSKNSPTKLVQFKTVGGDPTNYSAQILRRTYFQKINRVISPDKFDKFNKMFRNSQPNQKGIPFYGKINQINHVSGSKFKTIDPRFGGLSREELKQRIKFRSNKSTKQKKQNHLHSLHKQKLFTSLNMYDIEITVNEKGPGLQINRYNFISQPNKKHQHTRRKPAIGSGDRYSPWDSSAEQVVWDQLPKIVKLNY